LPCFPTRYIPSAITCFFGGVNVLLVGVVSGVIVMAGFGCYSCFGLLSIVVLFLKQV